MSIELSDLEYEELVQAINGMGEQQLLETYSTEQLNLLNSAIENHPKFSNEIKLNIPPPDPDEQARYLLGETVETMDVIAPITEMESDIGQITGSFIAPMLMRGEGANIGGKFGSTLGAAVTKTPQGAAVGEGIGRFVGMGIQSALYALGGGLTGRQTEAAISNVMNDTQYDLSLKEGLKAGGEEAYYDILGNVMFKSGAKIWSVTKNAVVGKREGAEELQQILARKGSTLSLDQVSDSRVIGFIGELLRGSPISEKSFDKLASQQQQAIVSHFDDLVEEFIDVTRRNVTEGGQARLIKFLIEDGQRLHQEAVSTMYSRLDNEIVLRTGAPKTVKTPRRGGTGGFDVEEVAVFRAPVDVSSVRTKASNILENLKDIGNADPTGQAEKLLKDLTKGKDDLTFRQTHELIAGLKRIQRDTDLKGSASAKVNEFIGLLQKQFDSAADSLPTDELKRAYKSARIFSKMGAQRFNNQFITKFMEADPSVMTEMLLKGTREDVIRLKRAISLAEKNTGRSGELDKIKASVLDQILPSRLQDIGTTAIYSNNKQLDEKLKIIFSPDEYARIKRGSELVKQLNESFPKRNTLGYQQGLGLIGLGGATMATADTLLGGILQFFTVPALASVAYNNKKVVSLLTTINKTDYGSKSYTNAAVKLARLLSEISEQAKREEQKQTEE